MNRLPVVFAVVLATLLSGCNRSGPSVLSTVPSTVAAPAPPVPPSPPSFNVSGTYSATLSASPSCASQVASDARSRQFQVTLSDTGQMAWSAADLFTPGGHGIVSSGHATDSSFSLVIGTKEDPQSDAFHGLWEQLSSDRWLTIAGEGSGSVQGDRITGSFSGMFHYYEGGDGGPYRNEGYCSAADHTFVLVRQTASTSSRRP